MADPAARLLAVGLIAVDTKKPKPTASQTPAPSPAATETPGKRVVVVMPAYNAAKTLERTYRDSPHDIVAKIILVDDVSRDDTVAVARHLGLDLSLIHI